MSSGEIILILFVYLLFFGAKGVPALAQTLGKAVYQFKNASRDVQNEIMKSANDMRKQAEIRPDQLDIADTRPKQPVVTKPESPVNPEITDNDAPQA